MTNNHVAHLTGVGDGLQSRLVSSIVLAAEYGMTHQNVYFIGKKYKDLAACPRGEGSACKAEYAGSNPAAASE